MKVNTGTFEASHGKKPRGTGAWMFNIGKGQRHPDGRVDYTNTATFSGTYTQAKTEALKLARRKGESQITVMP